MKVLAVLCLAAAASAMPQAGLVGPSGVIGPSGLVGPSGPVQFNQPAWAFLGNQAHAHLAAINALRQPARAAASFQPAPAVPGQYGVDGAGCVVGPSGKVCPTGNIQFT
nr:cuticle protein CP1158-like [Procambarus clarkii]